MANLQSKFKTRRADNTPFAAHFLTFQCYRGHPFLNAERTRKYFRDAVERSRERHGFHLWAYVLMPNHVHLMIWYPHEKYSVSETLRSIKQSVARRSLIYLRKHNPDGLARLATGNARRPYRFWQEGGGYDLLISDSEKIWSKIDYMHANPVRKSLVAFETDWTWSSAGDWSEAGQNGPIRIDKGSAPFA